MLPVTIISIGFAIAGFVLFIIGISRFLKFRWLSAAGMGVTGLIFISLAAVCGLLALNLTTYQRLVYEAPVADILFIKASPSSFVAELSNIETGVAARYELNGDEWQLDAQVLVWHGVATVLGLDTQFRLHRLSGRYSDISEEKSAQRSVYSLTDSAGLDVWSMIQKHQSWFDWVDAAYGSAVYLPMVDGARYRISVSRTGLIARPENQAARRAVSRWIGF